MIPTAGGKSLVIASFTMGVLNSWPDQRILILTHVREPIAQNHAEMMGLWPKAPAGIYSAAAGASASVANTKSIQAQSSFDAAFGVASVGLPADFDQDSLFWTNSVNVPKTSGPDLTSGYTFHDVNRGRVVRFTSTSGQNHIIVPKGYVRV